MVKKLIEEAVPLLVIALLLIGYRFINTNPTQVTLKEASYDNKINERQVSDQIEDEKLQDKPALEGLSSNYFMDINFASLEDLCRINGIGKVLAGRICDYRKENGPFYHFKELLKVKGIGASKLEKIKEDAIISIKSIELFYEKF